MHKIESNTNKIVKYVRALDKKRDNIHYIIEGERYIKNAPSHIEIDSYFVSETYAKSNHIEETKADVYIVKDSVFKTMASTINPSGMLALCKKNIKTLTDLLDKGPNCVLILENLQDPGNMGTIIRTAEAFGVDFVAITKNSVDVYNRKVLRATAGAIFHISIVQDIDLTDIQLIKDNGLELCVTSLDAVKYHTQIDFSKKNAIVIGNEANGVSENLKAMSNTLVKIPMVGKSESLNASVAASLILYESFKGRFLANLGI